MIVDTRAEEMDSEDISKLKHIFDVDIIKLLSKTKTQLLKGKPISQVKLDNFSYIGENFLENGFVKYDGDILAKVNLAVGEKVDKYYIYWGVRVAHKYNEDENMVDVRVKVRANTKHSIYKEWVIIASICIN